MNYTKIVNDFSLHNQEVHRNNEKQVYSIVNEPVFVYCELYLLICLALQKKRTVEESK
ncbi:uncharacterized protein (UPF0218 family) [Bacillus benzoevorans]|uniref:Uncharacterized protein (UPF0218 family) n=1 Tax=Bacillus benzoevorans TaxID=1456 RepID=A0A7X0LUB1_9BACI|nr:uncharacterized protein (UPF0218 family) [Bacillus benzoevorans]